MAHVAQASFGSHVAGSRPSFGGPPGWNSAQSQARVDAYKDSHRKGLVVPAQSAAVQHIQQGFGGISFTRRPTDGGFGWSNPLNSETWSMNDEDRDAFIRSEYGKVHSAAMAKLGITEIPADIFNKIWATNQKSKASIRGSINGWPPTNSGNPAVAQPPQTSGGSNGGMPTWGTPSGPQPGQSGDGSASFTEGWPEWAPYAIGGGVLVLGAAAIFLTRKKGKKGKR